MEVVLPPSQMVFFDPVGKQLSLFFVYLHTCELELFCFLLSYLICYLWWINTILGIWYTAFFSQENIKYVIFVAKTWIQHFCRKNLNMCVPQANFGGNYGHFWPLKRLGKTIEISRYVASYWNIVYIEINSIAQGGLWHSADDKGKWIQWSVKLKKEAWNWSQHVACAVWGFFQAQI